MRKKILLLILIVGILFTFGFVYSWNLSTCTYDSISISTQDTYPTGLFFKSDGTKLYEIGTISDKIYQYSCSTAWSLSTCTYDSISINTQDTGPSGLFFKSDGTKLYEIGVNSDKIYQYSCSTAWSLSTCTYDSISINTQDTTPSGLFFKSDGTKLYEVGGDLGKIHQYSCSTAWSLSSCSYDSISINTQHTYPIGLFFKSDGTKLYEIDANSDKIYQYSLETTAPTIIINYPNETTHEEINIIYDIKATDINGVDSCFYSLDNSSNISITQDYSYGVATGNSFDTSISGNGVPTGITNNGTYFWIIDDQDNLIYKYYMNGTYTGDSFSHVYGSGVSTSITTNGTYIWTGDVNDNLIYKYYMNGTYTGDSFDTSSSGNDAISALTTYEDNIFILDSESNVAYKYYMNGTYTGDSFSYTNDGFFYSGITTNGTYIWISGHTSSTIYKYYMNGTDTNDEFVALSNGNPTGITNNGNSFWITDFSDDKVYEYSMFSSNYTKLDSNISEGEHEIIFYCNDTYGNWNSSSINFNVDYSPPTINILIPESITYANNESINLNYTITEQLNVSSCWYKVVNSTSNLIINNQTLTNCSNSTFDVPRSDTYTLTIYANDTGNRIGNSSVTFSVSLEAPAIGIISPSNNGYLDNKTNVSFTFNVEDSDGLETCELWSNFTGNWSLNETFSSISSGVDFSTLKNLSADIRYKFNLWCNDSLGNNDFYFENYTFIIDETFPLIKINNIISTPGSQTIQFNSTTTDDNIGTCKYSIYNSTGEIDGINENVSFTCNTIPSATTTDYGNFTLKVYATDLAGNENSTNVSFSLNESSATIIGGGGGGTTVVQARNWTIKTVSGTDKYEVGLIKGTERELLSIFQNLGEEEIELTLSCEDEVGDLCQYVNISQTQIILPDIKEISTEIPFSITIPENLEDTDTIFNIVGTENTGAKKSITIDASVGTQSVPVEIISKLGLKTPKGIPYFLILFVGGVLTALLSATAIPKFELKGLVVTVLSLSTGFMLVYFI